MGFFKSLFSPFQSPPDYAGQAEKQEKNRQKLITQGTESINTAFSPFNQDFYNQRAQAYQNFALPQLSRQYLNTRNAMMYGLANRGLLRSTTAQQQYSDLNREMGMQKQAIADVGRGQAQDLQRQVEQQRNALLGQLYQSADPTTAGLTATNMAASFGTPSVYAPIGNMFNNLLNQYYTRQFLSSYQPRSYVSMPGGGYSNAAALPDVMLQGGTR